MMPRTRINAGLVYIACFVLFTAVLAAYYGLYGIVFEYNSPVWSRLVLLGGLLAVAFAAIAVLPCTGAAESRIQQILVEREGACVAMLLVVSLVINATVADAVLQGFPNSGDEYMFLFQAMTILDGRFWVEPHPLQEFFKVFHAYVVDGKWFGQYAPGWPMILAAGQSLAIPATMIGPLFGTLLVYATWRLARDLCEPAMAFGVAVTLTLTPFFLFNAASYFSHTSVGVFFVLAVLAASRLLESPGRVRALALGMGLGALGLVRHIEVVICVLPLIPVFLRRRDREYWKHIPYVLLGGLPLLLVLLVYNANITGDPFLPPQAVVQGYREFGFTGVNAFPLAMRRFILRGVELAEWASPLFTLAFAAAFLYKIRRRNLAFYDWYFFAFLGVYMLFAVYGGNRYGPRYILPAYPLMLLTVATAAQHFLGERPDRFRELFHRGIRVNLLLLLCMGLFAGMVQYSIIHERRDLERHVTDLGLENAVVMLVDGTGVTRSMVRQDLTRNGTRFDQPVLYAAWGEGDIEALRSYYPDREFWIYKRPPDQVAGSLERLD